MTINEHATEFAGKTIIDWEPGDTLDDPATQIPRIALPYDAADAGETWVQRFTAFLDTPAAAAISGLVVGAWDSSMASEDTSAGVVEALVTARDRLPNLRAIFLGDITFEESEISWINQSDLSPLFAAYPDLEHFRVRGGNRLSLGNLRLEQLRSLTIETGGLPVSVVREVLAAQLPALDHLELWLGTDGYGWDGTIDDLAPLFTGDLFPNLRYLGLRDSEIADEIAAAVAQSPLLERINVLDLSLGTLSDAGAEALLGSPAVRRLEKLDIHYHYCTPPILVRLEGLGIAVDASGPQEPDEYDGELSRYVAVGE